MTKKIKFSQKSPEIALCHPDYFFDQNGSFLRKMSVWKPSPSIYITYQEQKYDKENQIFSKIS